MSLDFEMNFQDIMRSLFDSGQCAVRFSEFLISIPYNYLLRGSEAAMVGRQRGPHIAGDGQVNI